MPEWWTYTLSDFLLFSPRTYYRLIERNNAAVWPGQIVTLGFGVVIAGLLHRPSPRQGRIVTAIVAVLWVWVAWAFLWSRYATINWAAVYAVWLFAIEVLLLVWFGAVRGSLSFRWRRDAAGVLGAALAGMSLALYPMLAPLLGRTWPQAEIFGIAPDPTAVATLGLLLLAEGSPRRWLMAVPVLWCIVSGTTLRAMGSPEAWVLLLVAVLVVALAVWPARNENRLLD